MKEYAFDVKMFAAIRVKADNIKEARTLLATALDCADANLGAWPDGDPILCELSMDGEAELFEVEGCSTCDGCGVVSPDNTGDFSEDCPDCGGRT